MRAAPTARTAPVIEQRESDYRTVNEHWTEGQTGEDLGETRQTNNLQIIAAHAVEDGANGQD